MKKLKMFSLRISEKEYKELLEVSKVLDISASELIRQLISEKSKKIKRLKEAKNEH